MLYPHDASVTAHPPYAPTLRELITYDPDLVLVETLDYLP